MASSYYRSISFLDYTTVFCMLVDWFERRLRARRWSVEDAAEYLDVEVTTLHSWIHEGAATKRDIRHLAVTLGDPYAAPGIGRVGSELRQGVPVEVNGTRWGVAKLIELGDDTAKLSLFGGPGVREERSVSVNRVTPVIVTPQTRCYLYDTEYDSWSVGRVKSYDAEADHYVVDLPGMNFTNVPSQDLEIRSAEVERAPTEVLVERGHETTFFYQHRSELTQALIAQRALTGGLTGLTSSRIYLYEHQVEVARRVLSDPLPRYILADEVGLGKTIEAGIIARQHLLDDPDATVVIVVPQHLLNQWQHEWAQKFALDPHDRRTHILTPRELDDAPTPTLLVVDEAHHVGQAFAHADAQVKEYYDQVRGLAHAAESVLLLTATPSALASEGLLGLLHLIDPVAYDLNATDAFHARLRQQEDIAAALSVLAPDEPDFLVKEGLQDLKSLFPEDEVLSEYIETAHAAVADDEASLRKTTLETIRHHVKETYRLFQRLLRHRRKDVEEGLINRADGSVHEEIGLDLRERDVTEALSAWREGLLASDRDTDTYRPLYLLLFELAGADLNLFAEAVRLRKDGSVPQSLHLNLKEERLLRLPKYDGEQARLDYLYDVAAAPVGEYDTARPESVANMVARNVKRGRHVVVFVTRTDVAVRLRDVISTSVKTTQRPSEEEVFVGSLIGSQDATALDQSQAFADATAGVLIVDRTGEEGLNLQFADVLVHYDLPFDPNRLEQRTGRLDRLGRTEPFDTHVMLATADEDDLESSPHYAWFRMVADAFGLFEESVASLQFYLDAAMPKLRQLLFQEGADGLLSAIDEQQQRAQTELRRIRQQDLLTTIDTRTEQVKRLWNDLQAAEGERATLQAAVDNLLSQVWRLRSKRGFGWTSYAATPQTMIPLDAQFDRFFGLYDQKVTAQRSLSADSSGDIDLLRPGSPWIERLTSFQNWDDRGQAYALWRHVPENELFLNDDHFSAFVFDVLLEADAGRTFPFDENGGKARKAALQRQGDALLPPQMIRVAVDPEGQIITDEAMLQQLLRPFNRDVDTNLHKDRVGVLDVLITHGWAQRCRTARRVALSHVAEQPSIQEALRTARRRLAFQRQQANYQRVRREAHGLSADPEQLSVLDRLAESIAPPRLRVDSVGFIALSNQLLWKVISPDMISPSTT